MATVDILYQNRIYQVDNINTVISPISEPFITIKNIFQIGENDLIIVIRAGLVSNVKTQQRVMNQISQLPDKGKCIFFIEDLLTDSSELQEFELVKLMAERLKLRYKIYHCEKNNSVDYYDWFVAESAISVKKIPLITTNFSKKICCLNRRYTDYRYLASAFLANYNNCLVTQYYSLNQVEQCRIDVDKLDQKLNIKTGIGILRGSGKIPDYTKMVDVDYTSPNAVSELIRYTQDCFCSLVTESKFHSTMPNFSEKTLRAIISGRPFILLAPPGTLALLKDLGFKTFSKYWDESYDLETDHTRRFEKVLLVVKDILEQKTLDIEPMLSILEHNQQHINSIPKRMYNLL